MCVWGVYAMCDFRFQGMYYVEAHAKCARFLTYSTPLWTSGPFYWMATALLCRGLRSFLGDGTSHTQPAKVLE